MQLLILTLHFGVWRRLELSIYAGKGHLEIGRQEPDSVFVLFGLLLSSWNRWIIWQVLWRGVTPTDDAVDVADEDEKGLMDMKRGMLSDTLPEAKSEEIGEDHDEKGAGLVAQGMSFISTRQLNSSTQQVIGQLTF
jgi:hypothetical protein